MAKKRRPRRRYSRRGVNITKIPRRIHTMFTKTPWWGVLLFGGLTSYFFYFLIPEYLSAQVNHETSLSELPVLNELIGRRESQFQHAALAILALTLYYTLRNLIKRGNVSHKEKRRVGFIARLFSRESD